MDSLLANYASSDEDEAHHRHFPPLQIRTYENSTQSESMAKEEEIDGDFHSKSSSKRGDIRSSPPRSTHLFNSPPRLESQSFTFGNTHSEPKEREEAVEISVSKPASSSLFSVLPRPISSSSHFTTSKKVVRFRPPTIKYSAASDDDDDEDAGEAEKEKQKNKQSLCTVSAGTFLSTMPAPKHSVNLGTVSSAMGSSRRYVLETDSKANVGTENANSLNDLSNSTSYDYSTWNSGNASLPDCTYSGIQPHSGYSIGDTGDIHGNTYSSNHPANYDVESLDLDGNANNSGSNTHTESNVGSYGVADYSYENTETSEGYTNYGDGYGDLVSSYVTSLTDSSAALPESNDFAENAVQVLGKRGRKDIPADIIEVKQDELMKNRPREDQVKLTGIALGPAYQPASSNGKPSKLHKRKHQIGSLFFDMKQKESELAERRSRGLMTKAQTQGKYGW